MARSLPPIGSLLVLTLLLMFVYGMVGWILFHEEDPENWGNIGDAMLTLFVMLTLENWPSVPRGRPGDPPASWIFFVSYILIASFLVINILLAIIINSMEEVREAERERDRARRSASAARRAGGGGGARCRSVGGDRRAGAGPARRPRRARDRPRQGRQPGRPSGTPAAAPEGAAAALAAG